MNLIQKIAGIPIAFPGWTQVVAYIFLALLALLIGVLVWRAILSQKDRSQLGEIHAKTNLILLMLRNWQERGELTDNPEPLRNEHYALDPGEQVYFADPRGSHRVDDPPTDQYERVN
jgi:hypothetical protein